MANGKTVDARQIWPHEALSSDDYSKIMSGIQAIALISGAGMWIRAISDGSNLTSPPE